MKIAIEGCAHGELEKIYDTISFIEEEEDIKIDLLICCGDFQSSRNENDLICMAVPPKYQNICTFYKYYSGEKKAPVLTIFIGGNHEASNYLQELPYGGWVAPNIYYLGYAGVINVAGIKIAGLSGIYKSNDYMKGHYEKPPYDENSKRSVYHVRNLEVFRLKQLSSKIDIFLSHDWPSEAYKFGNVQQLLKRKQHFREDIEKNELGSKVCEDLMHFLKPTYWFSAHLHCKYAALVRHSDDTVTKFLALDKCLPKRKFLQVIDVKTDVDSKIEISYDLEWLTILYLTNHLLWVKNSITYMPGPGTKERYYFTPTKEEMSHVSARFDNKLLVPENFTRTAPAYNPKQSTKEKAKQPEPILNPQTVLFCEKLAVDDPVSQVSELDGTTLNISHNSTMSFIDDTFDSDEFNSSSGSSIKRLLNLSLPDPKGDFNYEPKVEEDTEVSFDISSIESETEPTEKSEVFFVDDASVEEKVGESVSEITGVNDDSSRESVELVVPNDSLVVGDTVGLSDVVESVGMVNTSIEPVLLRNTSIESVELEDASDESVGTGDASVESAEVGNASVESVGTADASVDSIGVGDASVESVGVADASVESVGTGSASVESVGVGDASAETADASVESVGDASVESVGTGDASVESVAVGDASVESVGTGDASVESVGVGDASAGTADASVKSVGVGDASVESLGTGDASVESVGVVDASVESVGTGDASVESVGVVDASVESVGTGDASVESVGTGDASVGPVEVGDASVESVGVGDASTESVGLGDTLAEPSGLNAQSGGEPVKVVDVISVGPSVETTDASVDMKKSQAPFPPKKLKRRNIALYRFNDT